MEEQIVWCLDMKHSYITSSDGEWKLIVMGARKEYFLRLDDDFTSEKLIGPYDFDYFLEETYNTWTQRQDNTPTTFEPYNLWHYLELTGLTPPDL